MTVIIRSPRHRAAIDSYNAALSAQRSILGGFWGGWAAAGKTKRRAAASAVRAAELELASAVAEAKANGR